MELGIYTFGDLFPHPVTGEAPTFRQKLRDVVRLAKVADEVGLDVFGVGEHHRLDMAISSPAVVLAAIAEATTRIKLSSATTVLSTLDPVRVYEDFATLDLLSEERAEILVGRGSFTENFPLFGYELSDYDALFDEKIDLLLKLRDEERVAWSGARRPSLQDAEISPRTTRPIPVWIGVGGTPQSAARAGFLGLPMNIAILGGPERFASFARIHRAAAKEAGHAPPALAISSHGHLADDSAAAKEEHWTLYSALMRKGLRNRFPPRPIPREYHDMEAGPHGAIFAGDAKDAIAKILWEHSLFGHQRTLLQLDWGSMPFEKVRRSIEILGTEVAPVVRKALG
ncbi:MAG TPA: LLM class flavin-dependent oxidoreductase [Candidatus Thermoplasmatota archaeon]|nr:LLM class flavin-dependent oxidoreductase [Candidatus Thermoplasmatota archaeon]